MGVTIHFKGKLKDERCYERLIKEALCFAESNGWGFEEINETDVKLLRVHDDESPWDYVGPVKGIVLYPHEWSDPVVLEFDSNLYLQDYVSTQFSPNEVHTSIVLLLRQLESLFESFEVDDEGEFWDKNDINILKQHIHNCHQILHEYIETGEAQGPVRIRMERFIRIIDAVATNGSALEG